MLSELTIENVAVIERAQVNFDGGLNVLTGETGAGKSILIDSINAILGSRTTRELVRSGAHKASVWAVFSDYPEEVRRILEEGGYEPEDTLLLQREISADGKTSCRINGRPAAVGFLREIGAYLITIHGQHDSQNLLNAAKHLEILDSFAQSDSLLDDYKKIYHQLRSLEEQVRSLSMDEGEKQRRLDLLRYQVDEIDAAELFEGEEEQLVQQRNQINNARRIMECLNGAYTALQGDESFEGGVDLLSNAQGQMDEISRFSEDFASIAERLGDLYYNAQDLVQEIKYALDDFDLDPSRLEEIEERLDLLHNLKRKYGQTVGEILEFQAKAKAELETIEFSDQKLEELNVQLDRTRQQLQKLADRLTKLRKDAFVRFGGEIESSLKFLNMPGIRLTLSHQKVSCGPSGQDDLEFLISTNPGEPPKPLAKIASGGELSRIMLAIKSVMAEKDRIPTVIYDEIDAGVSGMAAGRVGQKLLETAHSGHQVICITHTPQIAACAENHLLIEKTVADGRTYTKLRSLQTDERVAELARIISGDRITPLALANAREMLELGES